jgi:hypothetical protein
MTESSRKEKSKEFNVDDILSPPRVESDYYLYLGVCRAYKDKICVANN